MDRRTNPVLVVRRDPLLGSWRAPNDVAIRRTERRVRAPGDQSRMQFVGSLLTQLH